MSENTKQAIKQLLESVTYKSEQVEIGGVKYIVKEMDGGQASEYDASLYKMVNNQPVYVTKGIKTKLVQRCLYTLEDEQVFSEGDMALVEKLPASVIDKVFQVATRLNALSKEVAEKN